MSSINRLPTTSTLSGSDLVAMFSTSLGSDAATTLTALLLWLQSQLSASGGFTTQYAAPNATGFSVTLSPPVTGGSVYLLLSPLAAYATGSIAMPATVVDGQEVLVSCMQAITTLTVSGNGNTINGAPTTLASGGFFRMRFDGVLHAWNRAG
jgi:hypothetical protein